MSLSVTYPMIKVVIGSKPTARRWASRGRVFVAEEGLIEGVDAGGEPGIQGVNARVEGGDIGPHFLAELGQVLAQVFVSGV